MLNKVNETIGLLLDYFEKDWDLILNVEKQMLIIPLKILCLRNTLNWNWDTWYKNYRNLLSTVTKKSKIKS